MDPEELEKVRSGIIRKLFIRPVTHDCYRRLIKTERDYIAEYAGFNELEMKIFDLRCSGMTFEDIALKLGYATRYCKLISSRIRKRIAGLIQ